MKAKIKIENYLDLIQQKLIISNQLKSSVLSSPGYGKWSAFIENCLLMKEELRPSTICGCGDTPGRALQSFVEQIKGRRIKIGETEFEVPENLTV